MFLKKVNWKRVAVVRNFRTTATDGKSYDTNYYNLDVIISVGYRVQSIQGTQFRIWATQRLKEYIVKGFVLNDERFKSGSSMNYFNELLTHAGKISHEMALKKSDEEYVKFQLIQKQIEKEQSLKEIEADIKKLKKSKK
jgi:hypothetical protein